MPSIEFPKHLLMICCVPGSVLVAVGTEMQNSFSVGRGFAQNGPGPYSVHQVSWGPGDLMEEEEEGTGNWRREEEQ